MTTSVIINSIAICDSYQYPLRFNPVNGAWLAPFSPRPFGNTGKLYIKVVCTLLPGPSDQLLYTLNLINTAHYRFLMGTGTQIQYIRQANSGRDVYLPVVLSNVVDLLHVLPADIQLRVCDVGNNPPNMPIGITRIIAL